MLQPARCAWPLRPSMRCWTASRSRARCSCAPWWSRPTRACSASGVARKSVVASPRGREALPGVVARGRSLIRLAMHVAAGCGEPWASWFGPAGGSRGRSSVRWGPGVNRRELLPMSGSAISKRCDSMTSSRRTPMCGAASRASAALESPSAMSSNAWRVGCPRPRSWPTSPTFDQSICGPCSPSRSQAGDG